jgi:hypothetical protein
LEVCQKKNQPSSYDETIAIMKSSVAVQEKTLQENKARVQYQDFVDGSGKHDWNSEQMKRTRELFEDQEMELLATQMFVDVCGRPCQTPS